MKWNGKCAILSSTDSRRNFWTWKELFSSRIAQWKMYRNWCLHFSLEKDTYWEKLVHYILVQILSIIFYDFFHLFGAGGEGAEIVFPWQLLQKVWTKRHFQSMPMVAIIHPFESFPLPVNIYTQMNHQAPGCSKTFLIFHKACIFYFFWTFKHTLNKLLHY